MLHAEFIVGKDCLLIDKGRICWLWKKNRVKVSFFQLINNSWSKNKGNYLQYSEEREDDRYYKKKPPPDKKLYNKGILETKFAIQWIKFVQWIVLSIQLLQNWGLYHKIYSELKPIHSPEIYVKMPFESNQAIFWPWYIWPKRTNSSWPICHLSFYISIMTSNLVWFQVANFYWKFIDW